MLFTFSGLTIDTTTANLTPSNDVGPVPGLRSLMQKIRQKRQLNTGDIFNHEFYSQRNKLLAMALGRARKAITTPPNAFYANRHTRHIKQVNSVFRYLYLHSKPTLMRNIFPGTK